MTSLSHNFECGQLLHDAVGQLFGLLAYRLQMYFGIFGCFIGRIEAGEILDRAGLRLGVKALRIAPRALVNGGVDEYLDEFPI